MLLTEDEAKKLQCCGPPAVYTATAALAMVQQYRASAQPVHLTIDPKCIGSACMAWRWDGREPPPTTIGYCGLAGEPWKLCPPDASLETDL